MNAAELELHVAATRAFILADSDDIVLMRREKESDGAGGYTHDGPVILAAQVARIIPQSDSVPESSNLDGRRPTPQLVILMEPDADMKRYDRFDWRGETWEITQVHKKPDYELKGDVDRVD